mmetsp:Transcript_8242/g.11996  ORF Transcript_8242/g.11996 Transcript_8242/m.11996 type:complete len:327 (-) Transcript_8242:1881-2861(-)
MPKNSVFPKTNCYTVSHFLALTLTGWICFISRGAEMVCSFAFVAVNKSPRSCSSCSRLHAASQLEQLASMTTLSIDSGDLKVIEEYASTGLITDATTNPLFVSQVGLNSGDPFYASLVNDAVNFAVQTSQDQQGSTAILTEADMVALAIDKLSVNLGAAISSIVKGFISTEVDPRLSFDTQASIERARRIIQLYQQMGVHKSCMLLLMDDTRRPWKETCQWGERMSDHMSMSCATAFEKTGDVVGLDCDSTGNNQSRSSTRFGVLLTPTALSSQFKNAMDSEAASEGYLGCGSEEQSGVPITGSTDKRRPALNGKDRAVIFNNTHL